MGIFTYIVGKLIYPIIISGGATYYAFSLGRNLPIASWRAGRWLGMQYNYLKITIKVFSPSNESTNLILSEYNKGSQQAYSFTREVR